MGCGRQFCKKCGEELIHRDHRKIYESSSALGQIVSREGPKNLSVADIDLVSLKIMNRKKLLRIIEQKQPNHSLKWPQKEILRLIAEIISHCIDCKFAHNLNLDNRSGVYIMRGMIKGAKEGKKITRFDSCQKIERITTEQNGTIYTHEDFFNFLDPLDKTRR